jgi:hypothetical protein
MLASVRAGIRYAAETGAGSGGGRAASSAARRAVTGGNSRTTAKQMGAFAGVMSMFGAKTGASLLMLSGIGLNLWSQYGDDFTDKHSKSPWFPIAGYLIAATGVTALAAKGGIQNKGFTRALHLGAGTAAIGAGVGTVVGLGLTVRTINGQKDTIFDRPRILPTAESRAIPDKVDKLAGVQVGVATVELEASKKEKEDGIPGPREEFKVFLDPKGAVKLTAKTPIGRIEEAQLIVREDREFRAVAIVKTTDGKYWASNLMENFDRIDGPFFTKDTDFAGSAPTLEINHKAVEAIVGAELAATKRAGAS